MTSRWFIFCVVAFATSATFTTRPSTAHAQTAAQAAQQTPPSPSAATEAQPEAFVNEEVRAAEHWALLGVGIPAGLGAAFSIATQPGGKTNVPVWQSAPLGGLFGFAGLWGVSMGYYRAHRPLYATLSGFGKTALLASTIAISQSRDCEGCGGAPMVPLIAVLGILVWDVWDYSTLEMSVRTRAATMAYGPATPYFSVQHERMVLGILSQF